MAKMTKDTAHGRIIAYCSISPELKAAADQCFVAYKVLNEKVAELEKTIPIGFRIKNFYGSGDLVIIESNQELDAEAKYWEENS